MVTDLRGIAVRFLMWWSDPVEREKEEDLFHPDVEYSQTDGFEGEDALSFIRQSPRWTDLKADIEVVPPDEVHITGTGTDPVTLLSYRLEWKLRIQNGIVRSVIESARRVTRARPADPPAEG